MANSADSTCVPFRRVAKFNGLCPERITGERIRWFSLLQTGLAIKLLTPAGGNTLNTQQVIKSV